jgi:hypothetical protein
MTEGNHVRIISAVLLGLVSGAPSVMAADAQAQLITPLTMRPIATIDERFLSYNVEMAEVKIRPGRGTVAARASAYRNLL